MYTQLYTQQLSFQNHRVTEYINQLRYDAAIIPDSIVSARSVFYYREVAS